MAIGAKYPATSLIAIGLVLINLAAFFVLLGGAAALQKQGATISGLLNQTNAQMASVLSYGDLQPVTTKGNFIGFEWFKAVFQAVTLLIALAALATGQFYRFRLALVGLFAALGVLFTDAAATFYYLYLQTKDNAQVPNKIKKEIQVYWSGTIITAAVNYLLVIVLGSGLDTHSHSEAVAQHTAPGVKETNGAGVHSAV